MSKKQDKKAASTKDESVVEVRVIDNFLDKTNKDKFMAVGDVYTTDKERADYLVDHGYVEYVDEGNNDADDADVVDPEANDDADSNANVNDTDSNEDANNTDATDDSNDADNTDSPNE